MKHTPIIYNIPHTYPIEIAMEDWLSLQKQLNLFAKDSKGFENLDKKVKKNLNSFFSFLLKWTEETNKFYDFLKMYKKNREHDKFKLWFMMQYIVYIDISSKSIEMQGLLKQGFKQLKNIGWTPDNPTFELWKILNDKEELNQFRKYLIGAKADENLLFLEQVDLFENKENNLNHSANNIYDIFIKRRSLKEVNISWEIKNDIYINIQESNIEKDLFEEAKLQIFKLLSHSVLPHYQHELLKSKTQSTSDSLLETSNNSKNERKNKFLLNIMRKKK